MVTRGEGGSRQTATNGDKGGRGFKNWDLYGDILFEWPLGGTIKRVFLYTGGGHTNIIDALLKNNYRKMLTIKTSSLCENHSKNIFKTRKPFSKGYEKK